MSCGFGVVTVAAHLQAEVGMPTQKAVALSSTRPTLRDLAAAGPTARTPVRAARTGTTPLRSRTPTSGRASSVTTCNLTNRAARRGF